MKVYVLIYEVGEYEERNTGVHQVFLDRARAENYAELAHPGFKAWNKLQQAWKAAYKLLADKIEGSDLLERIRKVCNEAIVARREIEMLEGKLNSAWIELAVQRELRSHAYRSK